MTSWVASSKVARSPVRHAAFVMMVAMAGMAEASRAKAASELVPVNGTGLRQGFMMLPVIVDGLTGKAGSLAVLDPEDWALDRILAGARQAGCFIICPEPAANDGYRQWIVELSEDRMTKKNIPATPEVTGMGG